MNHIDWFSSEASSSCSFPGLPFLPWKGKTKATRPAHSEWEVPIVPCWCKRWEQTDWLPQNWPCSLHTWCSNQETKWHQTRSCLHKGNHRQHSRADKASLKLEERSPCGCWAEASEFISQSGHCADHWHCWCNPISRSHLEEAACVWTGMERKKGHCKNEQEKANK